MKNKLTLFILLFWMHQLIGQPCPGTAGQVMWEAYQDLPRGTIGELLADEYFPKNPDASEVIYKLQSPINYDNNMGGRISGFIKVNTSDQVSFNVTGDDQTRFYLSTDMDPANLVLQAYADSNTGTAEHTKFASQTSGLVSLTAGSYYYFELLYGERTGSDHISLYWKTVNDDANNWKLVNANFIYEASCLDAACPERGTSCDDNDPLTTEDQEDGHCNCVGKIIDNNACIGKHREVTAYTYENIPGGSLDDLYNHQLFPGMPSHSRELSYLGIPHEFERDSIGTLIQGYLSVPVTGSYKFNITGNSSAIFFLSSDQTPENKQAHQILVTGSTNTTEHDKYIYQSTGNFVLQKGQYYYYELNHKESTGSEHYSVFWQTPFMQDGNWKRISDFYLYDYECEIACIPEGTPCEDGNPFTNNDVYDSNCECMGIPCSGPDCDDPVASYVPYASCDITDQIDNRAENNWLSCSLDVNPNSLRGNSHWIKYDFGMVYQLHGSQVWNYNLDGATDLGFETVSIDVSIDGQSWFPFGTYNWPQAEGSSSYSGFVGPNFNAISARYVLITSLDNPNSQGCRGIGKIAINASHCPQYMQACDDGDELTFNDNYNAQCECIGTPGLPNDCIEDHMTLGDTLLAIGQYHARQSISSMNLIDANGATFYIAGEQIDLMEGFEVPLGATFTAWITPCDFAGDSNLSFNTIEQPDIENEPDILRVNATPDSDEQIIEWIVKTPGSQKISILNSSSQKVFDIIDVEFQNKGIYQKRIRTHRMSAGVYQVLLEQDGNTELERMVVI